jgi:hypothetical protein
VTPGTRYAEFFDALLLLHRGQYPQALQRLPTAPEQFQTWIDGLWRPWYAAAQAEAAVLSGHPGAAAWVRRARLASAGNPLAAAVVGRAAALAGASRPKLLAAASALLAAGSRYQWARTLVFAGGDDQERGQAALASMGATAMPAAAAGHLAR